MKKIYTALSLVCFTAASTIAQPTLSGGDINPVVGESFTVHSINYTSPGSAGANVTWNFASVASTGTSTVSYVNPSTTPYGSNFPSATVALSAGTGAYDYYSATSTAYSRVGNANANTYIPYSNPEKLLSFPLNFNDTHTDSLYSSYTSNSVPMERSGAVTTTVDGYGTLILPHGTFTNVVRVKWVQDYQDYYQSMPMLDYLVTIYVWYKAGTHYPLFSLTSMSVNSGAPTEYGSYLDAASLGIADEEAVNGFTLFPNPASDVMNISYSIAAPSEVKISVLNMLGETVLVSAEESVSGVVNQTIDVSALSPGMYLVQIAAGNSTVTRKITIQ